MWTHALPTPYTCSSSCGALGVMCLLPKLVAVLNLPPSLPILLLRIVYISIYILEDNIFVINNSQ